MARAKKKSSYTFPTGTVASKKTSKTSTSKSAWGSGATQPKCWRSHKPLPITVKGKTYHVQGGSCHYDPGDSIDIFLGFDLGMASTPKAYPWNEGVEFCFPITDMCAPKEPKEFKQLIEYLAEAMLAGKNVYMGCIGGHGRTGTVLAALVTHMTGELDSIAYAQFDLIRK